MGISQIQVCANADINTNINSDTNTDMNIDTGIKTSPEIYWDVDNWNCRPCSVKFPSKETLDHLQSVF